MSAPPEPLTIALPQADLVVDATVVSVDAPHQTAVLRVNAVVASRTTEADLVGSEIVVSKQQHAQWAINDEFVGRFLLAKSQDGHVVVGRWGPYFRNNDEVAALAKRAMSRAHTNMNN